MPLCWQLMQPEPACGVYRLSGQGEQKPPRALKEPRGHVSHSPLCCEYSVLASQVDTPQLVRLAPTRVAQKEH